ncbi:MAG: bifunctional diaminohydroxyphosphoribosylaminopyrimidine deaminase/5-amino-6-(5-phosphoribosylamino)uracil reductase RibD [Crocinitomicaceae bacterium]|nr:bifunctional diaminohydroxyphosphoribosylaminopyrimidine deaminase/5-amino-6-(5-phosphoribosylamino)uracil reductase RibD [Crocinitomicaceae bacterium]
MIDAKVFMQQCLNLALKGSGFVAPNPMVGCVIVNEDEIIGQGYHQRFGEAHAEVNAINSVQNKKLLSTSTLYVNLEPCSHFGKTPPCADFIIEYIIPKVVIVCIDSNSAVAGKGIEKLRHAGIEVEVGILEKESRDLNRRFFTFHEKKRPYVILKWAKSADGFMDVDRSTGEKGIRWITTDETKKITHKWRSDEAAILVGWKTIANDNPELTCREYPGKNPIRIIIDPYLRLDYNAYKVGNRQVKTIIFTHKHAVGDDMLQFIHHVDFTANDILNTLYKLHINSVLIEGGKTTIENFIHEGIWDEARVLTGEVKFKTGAASPTIKGKKTDEFNSGKDQIIILRNA